jgi:hypothetical protein
MGTMIVLGVMGFGFFQVVKGLAGNSSVQKAAGKGAVNLLGRLLK